MVLLIPGRHQLITQFQFDYLNGIISPSIVAHKDINRQPLVLHEPIDAIVFAVTSANHSNTRRNPLPFYLRAISIEGMATDLSIPVYIYGIDDVGNLDNFASYTLKRLKHESDGLFNCTPQNTIVICSTPVLNLYQSLGFTILPAELKDVVNWQYHTAMPWDIVENISNSEEWDTSDEIKNLIHPASYNVWKKYKLGEKVQTLFRDQMISSDGDLTETRDYNVYVRQMDEIAQLKYEDTAAFIQPGRIGDIGCAVGSWIKLATAGDLFRESDFYGIEVSRPLFEICRQRKENGDFNNPFVFFSQKNAVTNVVFDTNSMNTIHTSSLTHEIESYGSRDDLLQFIKNRYNELVPGGVWINRDVVAPYNKEQIVNLWLNKNDGNNDNSIKIINDRHALSHYLSALSTYSRFIRFANDFRKQEGYHLQFEIKNIKGEDYLQLSLKDACEFLSRKDYTDNWQSEMHETFCFWDFDEWKEQLQSVGFSIHPQSTVFTNEWIVENRWKGKVLLYDLNMQLLVWPVTTMLLGGVK